MIVDKTKLGVPIFDDTFGGVFRGKHVLCCGRRASGKSILACHFVNQALTDGEKALLLSNRAAPDAVGLAESMGLPFARAVAEGQLIILDYATFLPACNASANVMLPPQSFMELQETIESQSVRRVAFDTVLPWVAIHPISRIAEHVYSFVHAVERLGVTALLTIPKPVSNPAFTLKSRLEDLCPISVTLDHSNGEHRTLRVTKYLGELRNLSTPLPFAIAPGRGLVAEPTAGQKRLAALHMAPPEARPQNGRPPSTVIRFPE